MQLILYNRFLSLATLTIIVTLPLTKSYSQLSYRNILSNTILIKLPSSFKGMDANTLSSKYPPNNKPSEVYTNKETTVNIFFKKTLQPLAEQNVFTEGKVLEQQLSNNGKVQLISSEKIKANQNNIYVFSFYSDAVDTKVYNVMFIFSFKEKMMIGSFNCISSLQNQWQNLAYDIIHSIKEI
jgi:hypothetical protein